MKGLVPATHSTAQLYHLIVMLASLGDSRSEVYYSAPVESVAYVGRNLCQELIYKNHARFCELTSETRPMTAQPTAMTLVKGAQTLSNVLL